MATKYVEHESKRCSKRKRGYSHYRRKNPVAKVPKRDDEDINVSDYYFENGLRKVYPYFYNFSTFVKGRWLGRTIYDVFSSEFKGVHSFKEVCDRGLLTVNGKPVPLDFVLKDQMFIEHRTHRHENPVVAAPIEILADTADLLVINKPSSIPVHPCGRYRLNSITMLLWKEYGYKNLRTLYRLDRLTSGVLLLPKTTAVSVKMEKQLSSKQLLKEYVCRVDGEFPEGTIECREAIGCISLHMGVQAVRPDGKESFTTFTRFSYNGRSSVVKCIPHTGRTHQIRVHLQFLGHPILNDPVYNSTAFGPEKGKGGKIDKSLEELELMLGKWHNSSEWVIGDNPEYEKMFGGDGPSSQCDADKTNSESVETVQQAEEYTGAQSEVQNTAAVLEKESKGDDFSAASDDVQADCHTAVTENNSASHVDTVAVSNDNTETTVTVNTDRPPLSDTETTVTMNTDILDAGKNTTDNDELLNLKPEDKYEEKDTDNTELLNSKPKDIDKKDVTDNNEVLNSKPVEADKSDATPADMDTSETASVTIGKPGNYFRTAEDWEAYVASKPFERSKHSLEKTCYICKSLYKEPTRRELVLFLHAYRYKGPDWEYSTPLPDWAREDWAHEDDYTLTENQSGPGSNS